MNYATRDIDALSPLPDGSRGLTRTAGAWASWVLDFSLSVATSPATERALLACALLNIPFQVGGPLWGQDEGISELGSPGGFIVTLTTLALFGLYARHFVISLTHRRERRQWRFHRALTAYFALGLVSLLFAERRDLSIFQLWLFAHSYFLFTYISNWARELPRVRFLVVLLLVGIVLNTAAAVCIDFIGHTVHVTGFFAQMEQDPEFGMNRIGLPWSPNLAASYVATALTLAFATLFSRPDTFLRRLAMLALIAGIPRLALTWSRGGWLEFLTAALIISCFSVRRGWISWRSPLITGLIAVVTAAPFFGRISQRLFSNDNGSTESVFHPDTAAGRLPLNEIAIEMIAAHPLLGVGLNNFPVRLPDYLSSETEHEYLATVHNNYLLIWSETGIVGLAAYLWVLSSLMRSGWRCYCANRRFVAPLGLAFLAAAVGLMLHMTVEKFTEGMDVFWVFAGLIVAFGNEAVVRPARPCTAPAC